MTKTYSFKNATIFVNGELSRERVREATIRLVQNSIKHNKSKGRNVR